MESPKTNPQAIELDPSCSGHTHSNRPGTGHGYESTELGCILTALRIPSIIRALRSADASQARLFKRFQAAGTNGVEILVSLVEQLRNYLKDHIRYDQGPGSQGKPRRVSLQVDEAQSCLCLT